MPLPPDYAERVYAGVLGKIIGVYLGRPFEGWTYERIMRELGEVSYYVNDRQDVQLGNRLLVVTDDDISGTFSFVRALPNYGNPRDLTPQQIGETWLNYIIEQRTILWWGGLGNSTEHTAFLRLKRGISAPRSGAAALNGKVVAEQIGAQIFIDGWAMVAPGDPELAADFARRAGSVSHDGEAIYGAQIIAAMQAQAFVERDLHALLDIAVRFIPHDSVIYRLIHDVREWREQNNDWRATRARIAARYGYDTYGGNCHMVPNHAVIMLGLLYGDDDFQRALMITNTAGWDTDCNSGNVGCLLGIKNGLAAFDGGPDWRGPVADRLYLPTADGGRAISDAVAETYHVVNIGRALHGEPPLSPKQGARFHFELPGSVQGFETADPHTLRLENVVGHSQLGSRSLALRYHISAHDRIARAATPTFTPLEARTIDHYLLYASPTLHSGQTVRASVEADAHNAASITCQLFLQVYGADDQLVEVAGPSVMLDAGARTTLAWQIAATGGAPIAQVGVALHAAQPSDGSVYLDALGWDGAPDVVLERPAHGGTMWRRAWVDATDQWSAHWPEAYRLVQNDGRGLLMQGTREWRDYQVQTTLTPHLAAAFGVAARVQDLRRYYALLLDDTGSARLVKVLDGEQVLGESDFAWERGRAYDLRLQVVGARLQGWVDGQLLFDVVDDERSLLDGAIGLVCEEGRVATEAVAVRPPTL